MASSGDASPGASPRSPAAGRSPPPLAPVASAAPSSGASSDTRLAAKGLEDSESDGDDDDNRGRKRRRLRRGAPAAVDAPASPSLSQLAAGDDDGDVDGFVVGDMEREEADGDDDYGEQAEELDEEIVDELDIQERERRYFSEDELDDDVDGEDLGENAEM
ncbi:unnamed protein product [Phytophthora lilii]|uniref:Unnamed protein product n=1 Tax=Phytophthora lilii TaxID=2077276 RepID=A0A9W6X267_9STRA|nr:unnamed protein product [Phytophthora lilii]